MYWHDLLSITQNNINDVHNKYKRYKVIFYSGYPIGKVGKMVTIPL